MRAATALVGLAPALLLVACGHGVVDAVPQAPTYQGPLYVEPTEAPDDPAGERTGAASLVVDCDSPSVGYAEYQPFEDSVSRSPAPP